MYKNGLTMYDRKIIIATWTHGSSRLTRSGPSRGTSITWSQASAASGGLGPSPILNSSWSCGGRFRYELDGKQPLVVEPGQVLCIFPDENHTLTTLDTPKHAMFSCIHCELVESGSWAMGDYRLSPAPQTLTTVEDRELIDGLFKRCRDVFCGYSRYRYALLRAILQQIWINLAQHWSDRSYPQVSPRIAEMLAFIRKHLREPISRCDIAEAFSLTPEHVNALFKKELGVSPTQLIHRERVYLACQYLQAERITVKQAAQRVGFYDQFYFSKVFKRIMGVSPREM